VSGPSVTIPFGQSFQTFTLTTTPVTSSRTVNVTASYLGALQTVSLTVNPPAPVTLSSLTITPSVVAGGATAQGTVTLTGPATVSVVVGLTSSSAITATVPALVTIPAGQSSATFTIRTNSFPRVVTITATVGDVNKQATLTVQ
jgi:hypothetical protein